MRSLVVTAMVAFAMPAQADEWVRITSTDTDVFSAKAGSFELRENKAGEAIAVVTGSVTNTRSKKVSYAQWYVTVTDCQRGMGNLVALTTSGTFDFETDFVAGGNSAGAGIADAICTLYKATIKVREGKGL